MVALLPTHRPRVSPIVERLQYHSRVYLLMYGWDTGDSSNGSGAAYYYNEEDTSLHSDVFTSSQNAKKIKSYWLPPIRWLPIRFHKVQR